MERGVIMNKIFMMADIHGSVHPLKEFVRRNKDTENFDGSDIMILLGDSAFNYFLDERDFYLKRAVSKLPFTFFVIRGNHEERPTNCMKKEPDKWQTSEFFGGTVYEEKDFPKIKYAEDGPSIYNIPHAAGAYKTLVLPGAYSVDKFYRLMKGWNWFADEQMSESEREFAWDLISHNQYMFDLVLSHTCPCAFEPTDLFLSSINQSIVDKDMERFLRAVEYAIDYKLWCFGHFHQARIYPFFETKQVLMLYNDKAIELNEWMNELQSCKVGGFY